MIRGGYVLYPGTPFLYPNRQALRVLYNTIPVPDKFCDLCQTFIPVPDSPVTFVTNPIPYRAYTRTLQYITFNALEHGILLGSL